MRMKSRWRLKEILMFWAGALSLVLFLQFRLNRAYANSKEASRRELVTDKQRNGTKIVPVNPNVYTFEETINIEPLVVDGVSAPHAYVFLLASTCRSDNYRGFLWNILVSARKLRSLSDKADVVVLIHADCILKDEKALAQMGAKIVRLPVEEKSSFSSIQLLKFHVFRLTQYRRVLYMDADIMALCSLNYLFHLSDEGKLGENVVLAWTQEPANGGFFLVTPRISSYASVVHTVARQKSQNLPLPHFDKINGWGHVLTDKWYSYKYQINGLKWSFYASWSDQGLLYHITKYVLRDVSIIVSGKAIQQWRPVKDGVELVETSINLLQPHSCRKPNQGYLSHPAHGNNLVSAVPHADFAHFYSRFKPWSSDLPETKHPRMTDCANVVEYWFWELAKVNEEVGLGLPLHDPKAWKVLRQEIGQGKEHRVPTLKELQREGKSIHDV